MIKDPTIDRIRSIRHIISKEFHHNPEKLIKYYIELQKKHQKRLIKPSDSDVKADNLLHIT